MPKNTDGSPIRGTLKRVDLGAGAWVLDADDGQRYQLDGDVPSDLKGQRVEVEGEAVESWGFAMTGPTIAVKRVREAS